MFLYIVVWVLLLGWSFAFVNLQLAGRRNLSIVAFALAMLSEAYIVLETIWWLEAYCK